MRSEPYTNQNSFQKNHKPRCLKKKKHFNSILERDIFAMKQVLQILKQGTIRWIGEIGRQY